MRSLGTGVAVGVGGGGVLVGGTGVALGATVGAAVGVGRLKPPQPASSVSSVSSSAAAVVRIRVGLERCVKLVVQLRFFAKVRHLTLLRTRLGRAHHAVFLKRINQFGGACVAHAQAALQQRD